MTHDSRKRSQPLTKWQSKKNPEPRRNPKKGEKHKRLGLKQKLGTKGVELIEGQVKMAQLFILRKDFTQLTLETTLKSNIMRMRWTSY